MKEIDIQFRLLGRSKAIRSNNSNGVSSGLFATKSWISIVVVYSMQVIELDPFFRLFGKLRYDLGLQYCRYYI